MHGEAHGVEGSLYRGIISAKPGRTCPISQARQKFPFSGVHLFFSPMGKKTHTPRFAPQSNFTKQMEAMNEVAHQRTHRSRGRDSTHLPPDPHASTSPREQLLLDGNFAVSISDNLILFFVTRSRDLDFARKTLVVLHACLGDRRAERRKQRSCPAVARSHTSHFPTQ